MEVATGINQHNLAGRNMTTDSTYMNPSSGCISIGSNNISKYGFVCFHQPGECKIDDGYWIREVNVNVQPDIEIQEFLIPENLCTELSSGEKIIDSNNYEIASSSISQDAIELLLQRAGWNQTREDLNAMMHDCNGGTFIANYSVKQQKIPLGSGVAFPVNDDLCWIGMILVHPELRRQGIAGSIMNQCLKHARLIQNKSIVGLDATPLGKQVYDSLGFKDSFTIWRSVINTSSVDGNNESRDLSVIPFDLNSAKKYLQKVGFAERLGIMEILGSLPETKNFMVFESSDIKGIILSRPGRLKPYIGPLIADSSTVALILIQKALNYWKELDHEEVLMDIPAQHLNDSIFINGDKSLDVDNHQIPVKPIRSFIRMYQLVFDAELLESPSDPAMKKALNCHEETAVFMQKEKEEIVPIMFGTSGPEWS